MLEPKELSSVFFKCLTLNSGLSCFSLSLSVLGHSSLVRGLPFCGTNILCTFPPPELLWPSLQKEASSSTNVYPLSKGSFHSVDFCVCLTNIKMVEILSPVNMNISPSPCTRNAFSGCLDTKKCNVKKPSKISELLD